MGCTAVIPVTGSGEGRGVWLMSYQPAQKRRKNKGEYISEQGQPPSVPSLLLATKSLPLILSI